MAKKFSTRWSAKARLVSTAGLLLAAIASLYLSRVFIMTDSPVIVTISGTINQILPNASGTDVSDTNEDRPSIVTKPPQVLKTLPNASKPPQAIDPTSNPPQFTGPISNASKPPQVLDPLSNASGVWMNLTTETEIKLAQDCPDPWHCCQSYHVSETTQQKFMIRTNSNGLLEPRSVLDTMELLRSKNVAFVGDSLTKQVYEVFVMGLIFEGVPFEYLKLDALPGKLHGSEKINLVGVHVPAYNVTLTHVKSYRYFYRRREWDAVQETLREPVELTPADDIVDTSMTLDNRLILAREQMADILDRSNVIIFNYGMHYLKPGVVPLFEPTIKFLLAWLKAEMERNGKLVVVRDVLPNHGPKYGDMESRVCLGNVTRHEYQNRVLKKWSNEFGIAYLESEEFYLDRAEAKKGRFYEHSRSNGGWDCLHFCANRYWHAPIVNGLYEAVFKQLYP
ncbi:hypothetical protein HDU81_004248 [Chytriomyces hyalinus]|nr:hypothetical protein HDU81_004248 [Chytriomyces hyalinus]